MHKSNKRKGSKESQGSAGSAESLTPSQWDLFIGSNSSGFIQIDDDAEDRWNVGQAEQSISSHGLSSKSSYGQNQSDHIFYEDMDLVTDSQHNLSGAVKKGGEFEIERWWLLSFLWQRLIVFMLLIFLIVALVQLSFAIYCFALIGQEWDGVPDPYVCATAGCSLISENMIQCINASADPCTDFYQYACGSYTNDDEDPRFIPNTVRLTHAFEIYSASQDALTKILKPNGKGDTTDNFIELYKACINKRKRIAIGIDPLLRTIRTLSPSAFGDKTLVATNNTSSIQDSITFGKLYHETALLRIFLLPDHKIALSRPQWLRDYRRTFQDMLVNNRADYELHMSDFFSKLWARMEILGLIQIPPYPATEAAELVLIMMNGVINYVYNPNIPLPVPYPQAAAIVAKVRFGILLKGILDDTIDPLIPPTFKVVTSQKPGVRHAFGSWEDGEAGGLLVLFAQNGRLFKDLTSGRKPPKPDTEFQAELFKALHAFRIFLLFSRYSGDIRPEQWAEYGLDKVYPDRFVQDSQRFLKIESFCLSSTVFYLNSLTQARLFKIFDEDKLSDMRGRMSELHINTIQSLRRWYELKERAGEFSPRVDAITREFLSVNNRVLVQFPLPEPTAQSKERIKQQVGYLDTWQVDPANYLKSIQDMTGIINAGRLIDWRNNALTPGENHRINLDFVSTAIDTQEELMFQNRINFPLLLLEPPYFLNDMSVFDFAGTAIYMARAELQLWLANTVEPGGLEFGAGILEGLDSGKTVDTECRTVTSEDTSGKQQLSFMQYMANKNGEGLNSLAIKVAYDLYKHPEPFRSLIDVRTGQPATLIVNKDESVEFITPHFHSNGSVSFLYYTTYPNRTSSFRPVDTKRFVSPKEYEQYKLKYKMLINLEHYTQDQLFFLHSMNSLCFSSHGRGVERFDRYGILLNGVYQQMVEFAEAFDCSRNSPMNPAKKCLREHAAEES